MQSQATNNASIFLTEADAAAILNLSVRTLQSWRLRSRGPAYLKAGKAIRYQRTDLLDWIRISTVCPGEGGS